MQLTKHPDTRPSIKEIAELLDLAIEESIPKSGSATFRWLIDHQPELRRIWEELQQPTALGLSGLEIARLAVAVEEAEPEELERSARRLLALIPTMRKTLDRLDQMAADLGGKPDNEGWVDCVLAVHEEHRRLMRAREDADPERILNPSGEIGVDYERLIAINDAQLMREESPRRRERLQRVRFRLREGHRQKCTRRAQTRFR